jgi:copper chaperone
MMATIFNVENMKCSGCSANVEKALDEVSSVESVSVKLDAKTVEVGGDIDTQAIAKVISDAGYPAKLREPAGI